VRGIALGKVGSMKLRTFLIIVAAVGFLYAIGLLLMPEFVETLYGSGTSAGHIMSDRYFGASLLNIAVIAWLARDLTGTSAKPVITGGLIGFAVAFVVSLTATLAGTMNAFGWSAVLIYLVLGLGFAYFQFAAPAK
jgi:hypothetical protein